MIKIVFDPFHTDRSLAKRYFPNAGDLREYEIDSEHTSTTFTHVSKPLGFVFVGTPNNCDNFIEEMHNRKKDFISKGYRASPEVVDFDEGIAAFAFSKPGARK